MTELRSVEEARDAVLAAIAGSLPSAPVAVEDALGRVLARDVAAAVDLPPWPNSAMDGYALRSADVAAATEGDPVRVPVTGEVAAGRAADDPVPPGTAYRIATGARLPEGADSVVAVESTTPLDDDGRAGPRGRDAAGPLPPACLVHEAVIVGANVRRQGSDLRKGDRLAEAGRRVDPWLVGLMAGAGIPEVHVHRMPRVAVLATGDEVRPAGDPLGEAAIPDANGPGLRALVRAAGGAPIDLGIASDTLDDVLGRLHAAVLDADAIIVSGGVSVGPYDVVKQAFDAVGRVDLWRVAVQPGKPFTFGTATGPHGPVLLFGLPGNPVSGSVTFELFVRPALRRLGGETRLVPPVDRGVLLDATRKGPGRRAYLRVVAERDDDGLPRRDGDGRVRVRLAGGQGSHVMSALAAAEAFAIVPETMEQVPAGSPVGVWWLER
jgi:molybdopterin molybdotransferase